MTDNKKIFHNQPNPLLTDLTFQSQPCNNINASIGILRANLLKSQAQQRARSAALIQRVFVRKPQLF